jgi:cytochrome c peroxidase
MRLQTTIFLIAAFILLLFCLGPAKTTAQGQFYANALLPPVPVPTDNPQIDPKVRLGAQLYFDTRLSSDNTVSCASCHSPEHGWADPNPTSEGVGHVRGARNAPTVLNAAYNRFQFWDGRANSLEEQSLGPIQNPVEMGMTMPEAISRVEGIPGYVEQFKHIFNQKPTEQNIAWAIAAFERTVLSTNSPFDRYLQGDRKALSNMARLGLDVFQGKGHCLTCHSGPNFTDDRFHNLGVGYKKGKFADSGRYNVTKDPADMGAFKTPSLRSVALTAPYLHDGSEPTLESVVEFYDKGGIANPNLDPKMMPLNLTAGEKAALVKFLEALTGEPLKIVKPELPQLLPKGGCEDEKV